MICGFGGESRNHQGQNKAVADFRVSLTTLTGLQSRRPTRAHSDRCMAREGERKRKAGIELDFDKLLPRDDEPPPELLIQEKSEAEETEPRSDNYIRNLSEKDLKERITRDRKFLNATTLSDGGAKLRAIIDRMEAELARRSLEKVGFLVFYRGIFVSVCHNSNYCL